jgi:hypothetical protein
MTGLLLAAGFAVILVGAVLFTNAVEWLAHQLELGSGAAGSVLAAVATALPESTIPIVAIIGGAEGSEDVAIGAIIGAPFMLATIAMALVGLAAIGFAKKDAGLHPLLSILATNARRARCRSSAESPPRVGRGPAPGGRGKSGNASRPAVQSLRSEGVRHVGRRTEGGNR